jgi:dihydrofolate reductase
MSAVRYYCAMSLDGFIAESNDTLDWLRKYEGTFDAVEAGDRGGYERFYEQVGALVMGSVTYGSSPNSRTGRTLASRRGC